MEAIQLRAWGLKPYSIAKIVGTDLDVELVSYPYQDSDGRFYIKARRTPHDPTTMDTFLLPEEAIDLINSAR